MTTIFRLVWPSLSPRPRLVCRAPGQLVCPVQQQEYRELRKQKLDRALLARHNSLTLAACCQAALPDCLADTPSFIGLGVYRAEYRDRVVSVRFAI